MQTSSNHGIIHVPRRFVSEEWGGTETVVLEVARQQQRSGAKPEILTSMALASRAQEMIGGIPVKRFDYSYPFFGLSRQDRQAMDKKGGNLLSFSLFKALLTQPDVRLYHAHALKRLGGQVRTAARLRKKPFVVSLHGGVFDVPEAERAEMLKPIANKPEWGKLFGALFGSRRILNDADQVICVGQNELEKARQNLGHDRIAYLPNGVDAARFAEGNGLAFRHKHGIPAKAFVVLNISRIDAQKNQLLLLEAFHLFRAQQPAAVLVMMGPETQPDYAAKLRTLIQQHELGNSVRFLPGIRNDSPELVDAYHASDVFVLPSMHEPFGIVVLEAWSAGRPVIVNRVGGLKHLVRHGETGLFINNDAPASAADLSEKLHLLSVTPALRLHLGAAGRAEARHCYDWKRIAEKLEGHYQSAELHCSRRHRKASV